MKKYGISIAVFLLIALLSACGIGASSASEFMHETDQQVETGHDTNRMDGWFGKRHRSEMMRGHHGKMQQGHHKGKMSCGWNGDVSDQAGDK